MSRQSIEKRGVAIDRELRERIAKLVEDLAAGRLRLLVDDGRAGRLSEDELRRAVEDYGRTLVPLPEEAWGLIEIYEQTENPDVSSLDVPLWTIEEGQSDLTLSISVTKSESGISIAVDDLHVL